MDLVLVRHAESVNNVQQHVPRERRARVADPPLTALGERQAAQLAAAFAAGAYPRPDRLYCSLMLRAVATAAPIATALDLDVTAHPEAFETFGPVVFNGADLAAATADPGASRADLLALHPRLHLPDSAGEGGWWPGPVETWEAATVRAARFAADLIARHGDGDEVIGVVSHGSIGHLLLHHLLGAAPPRIWLHLDNTSVTLITGLRTAPGGDDDSFLAGEAEYPPTVLRYLGRTDHLRG